jgi:nitrite reductase/ring-hydroxylating ferredoxin subunit
MPWIRVCAASALDVGNAIVVDRDPLAPIAVFNVDGEFFATDDTCTHEQYSLADGYVDGDVVECALHMARFNLRTGKALRYPATKDLKTYEVKVDDGFVFVLSADTDAES